MLRLAERLYLGKCRECQLAAVRQASLLYACHWPCARARQPYAPLEACPVLTAIASGRENGRLKFFNLINTEIPNYQVSQIVHFLDLIDQRLAAADVYLIGEQAESRAPSLALLWLAFRGGHISRSSFAAARADFSRLYPGYAPWPGWVIFCEQEWDALH
jgi:hypothetical protein